MKFAGVDLIQEKTKADGKAGGCYVTEVNGNPGTGIIDITGYNYFTDLVKHIVAWKQAIAKAAADGKTQDSDNQASAMGSYPADMIHASMTPQQVADACLDMIMNDATFDKIESQNVVAGEILDSASLSEQPVIDSLRSCEASNYAYERFSHKQISMDKPERLSFLSEASAHAIEYFKKLNR